jgi:hypothetical protein
MLTAHEIYVPIPQAFEALVGGAEASPAPAHPEESTCEVVKAAYAAEEGGGNA